MNDQTVIKIKRSYQQGMEEFQSILLENRDKTELVEFIETNLDEFIALLDNPNLITNWTNFFNKTNEVSRLVKENIKKEITISEMNEIKDEKDEKSNNNAKIENVIIDLSNDNSNKE